MSVFLFPELFLGFVAAVVRGVVGSQTRPTCSRQLDHIVYSDPDQCSVAGTVLLRGTPAIALLISEVDGVEAGRV